MIAAFPLTVTCESPLRKRLLVARNTSFKSPRFIFLRRSLLHVDGGGYEFNDPSNELATGVTVADFISRLDVEWE